MPISFQGQWTITVKVKNPQALPQRFIVSGAQLGNGTYNGFVGTSPVTVSGTNWQLNIQANEAYEQGEQWINSSMRTTPQVQLQNGQIRFDVESEDLVQDNTWDDLILTMISPVPQAPPPVVPPPVVPPPPPPTPPVIVTPPTVPPPPPPPVELGVGKVYTIIEDGDRLPKQTIKTTYGIWLDYTGSMTGNLTTFFTCSADTGSYKKSVFQSQCFTCSSKPQFDIAYGHDDGSGSRDLGGNDWYTPSNAIYGQYRSLCLPSNQQRFKVGNKEIQHFYAINIKRDRMGDRLDEGHIELNLAELSGSKFLQGNPNRNAHTGSNVKVSGTGRILRLIDDSTLNLDSLTSAAYSGFYQPISESKAFQYTEAGETYYMVSGSLEDGVYGSTQPQVFGLMYPRLGVVLLDADLLDLSASFLTVTGSDVAGDNSMKLFTAISGAALYTDASGDVLGFQLRKVKYSYVEQYFIRVKNVDYNFTNNPTYVTGSEGDIVSDFYNKPIVYITSIGLYNDNHDLLAVGKVSVPIYKSFTDEALFTVSINYE